MNTATAIDHSKKVQEVVFLEPEETTSIGISLPKKYLVQDIDTLDGAYNKIKELTSSIRITAEAAFGQKSKPAWDAIQTLLYYWNHRDLLRIDRVGSYVHIVENALRKIVLDTENKYLSEHALESVNDFSPERAVQELADKAHSHRINNHPLLEQMENHGIPMDTARLFLDNYYVNNRLFHLFIAALSLSTPMSRRTELANNFFDEMGSGDNAMAHPNLFLKNFDTIGRPSKITPIPEALSLVNAKTFAAFSCGDYYYGMGGFGYIELAMPKQMEKILKGLGKSGFSRENLEFWETHITIDLEHGKAWFGEMRELIKTPEQAQKCLAGGMRLLDARASMYDGVWERR